MSIGGFRGFLAAAGSGVWDAVVTLRVWLPRPLRWLLDDPRRLLTVAWCVGLLVVGGAQVASGDIIVGPDLARGGPKTLYESYDFADYKLTVKPDDENSDWFGVSQAVLEVVGFINNLLMWACLGILYGALSLLLWFLNLTLYRDSAPQIDAATQAIANGVFWPLISATVAVGAFLAYARWRGEGRGFVSDFGWIIAATTLAVGFAAGPSTLMNEVDSLRQDLATGVISGSSHYATTADNVTGFPTPPIGGDPQQAGSRKLVDSVWNTFGATSWCFAQFHDLEICKQAGHHALAGDEQWKAWMAELDAGGAPQVFGNRVHWIRGQDMTRTGYLLVLLLITIPMGLLLLRLVVAGLITVVGFLLMLVIGLVFLVFWPIPGWFRQTGTQYWIYTLGMEIQALFITVVISGAMVVSATIATQAGKYGFFVVAVLNLGVIFAAVRARTWLEMLTTTAGAGSMGFLTALAIRSVARTAARGVGGLVGGGLGLAWAGARGAAGGIGRAISRPVMVTSGGLSPTRPPFRMRRVPRLEPDDPIRAAATRLRPGLPPGTPPALPAGGAPPGRPGGGPPRALPPAGGGSRGPTPTPGGTGRARPSRADRRLSRNVGRAQAKTGRTGRVWVDRKGVGLSPLDPSPPAKGGPPPPKRQPPRGWRPPRSNP